MGGVQEGFNLDKEGEGKVNVFVPSHPKWMLLWSGCAAPWDYEWHNQEEQPYAQMPQ